MTDTLTKLRPDRDLQCYFERPSAIAALSDAAADRFTVSGCWRQQFDWAVVEWNRDNVFEHPHFRNLPDGDLSGVHLAYRETRINCMPIDCDIYPTVDWPYLRVWATAEDGIERLYRVRLLDYAQPVAGTYRCATAEFEITGTPRAGDYVGLAWLSEHHTHQVYWDDTLDSIAEAIAASVNAFSSTMVAERTGARIRLTYVGAGGSASTSRTGVNGNRIGVYGQVTAGSSLSWDREYGVLSGGTSPDAWAVTLDFSNLTDETGVHVPTHSVRKLRWTYAAAFQAGEFERSEFEIRVTDWSVSGSNLQYRVAGPGSRRLEDDDTQALYTGTWHTGAGNFSSGSVRYSTDPGSAVQMNWSSPQEHELYIGSRYTFSGAKISVTADGGQERVFELQIPGEDALARMPVGRFAAGSHSLLLRHAGDSGTYLYFDYAEIAIPTETLPAYDADQVFTLATDWDTDHSIALAPERTAWQMHSLGFHGRANHYTGAMWFYELTRTGHSYASAKVTFDGIPEMSQMTVLTIGRSGDPPEKQTRIDHLNLAGDTAESIARAFELELNRGYMGVRATATGNVIEIFSRTMGEDGNAVTVSATPESGSFRVECSSRTFEGGQDGAWRTDLTAVPRINRACRDWSRSFFRALNGFGIPAVAAFSLELQHGDPSDEIGIAQAYPDGKPVLLNTPALQTNFSPVSTTYWQQVYLDMARLQVEAGMAPYLQFGEVQWWYFPNESGMTFYDAYTRERFRAEHSRDMKVIRTNSEDPALYTDELRLAATLIGEFTLAVINHVRAEFPNCRFEVLYPPDVNETALNTVANYPTDTWTTATLDCLKTENFSYTYARNLDACSRSMRYGRAMGFPREKTSHLVGISDPVSPWRKEASLAISEGTESLVLFALDQFCLIGYSLPVVPNSGRSVKMG